MSENSVSLADECLGKKLTEVPEPNYGDFELRGLCEAVDEIGLVIIRLRGINGPDAEALLAAMGIAMEMRGF